MLYRVYNAAGMATNIRDADGCCVYERTGGVLSPLCVRKPRVCVFVITLFWTPAYTVRNRLCGRMHQPGLVTQKGEG